MAARSTPPADKAVIPPEKAEVPVDGPAGFDDPELSKALSSPLPPDEAAAVIGRAVDRALEVLDDRPRNVVQAIACVTAEIGGVPRMTQAQRKKAGMHVEEGQGVPWAYRGIDQIAQAAQPLMGKYGVVIVPNVVSHHAEPVVKGKATIETTLWYRQAVTVDWSIYGPGGVDDMLSARTIGIGDDNSDKGMNKAMTTAYKNLLLRLLCIGDPQDDTDNVARPTEDHAEPPEEEPFITQDQANDFVAAVVALPEPHKSEAKHAIAERFGSTRDIRARQWVEARDLIAAFQARTTQDEAGEAQGVDGETPKPEETTTDTPDDAAARRAELAARKLAEAGLSTPGQDEVVDDRDGLFEGEGYG